MAKDVRVLGFVGIRDRRRVTWRQDGYVYSRVRSRCVHRMQRCYHTASVRGTTSSTSSPGANCRSSSRGSTVVPSAFAKLGSLAPGPANVNPIPSSSSVEKSAERSKPISTSSPIDAMNTGRVDAGSGLKCRVGVSAKGSSTVPARPSSTLRRFRRKRHARTDVALGDGMFVQRVWQG